MSVGLRVGIAAGARVGLAPGIAFDEVASPGSSLQIGLIGGQSNGNGWAFVANQISVPGCCYAYSAVKEIDHGATVNGDPLVWTFDRPVSMAPPLPDPTTVTPVSLSPRTGDGNGDCGVEAALFRRLDRAQPGRWALAKMCIPSSSMLNWETNADGSTYPTTPPHLIDQWLTYLTFVESALRGQIAFVIWHQGESDAQTGPLSTAWAGRLTNFIAATRSQLGRTVPFYLPKLHTGAGGTGNATIRAAQATLAGSLQRVTVIDMDPLAVATLHYTADQYALGGVIEAKAIMTDLGINDPPFASFSWSWSGTNVTFTDASTAGAGRTITSRLYNFGDSTTSTSTNPSHNYGALGTYTVTLTVTDDLGATNVVARLVTCAAGNWTVDSKRGVAIPVNATEWAALMTAAGLGFNVDSARRPGSVAATPIGDDVGAFPQTVAGATVQFQSPHPSMSTLGLRTINNVTDGYSSTDAALPDVLTTSCLKIVVAAVWTIPTSVRGLFSMGTTETSVTFNSSNPQRIVARSNTQNTTGTVDLDNEPHIYFLRHNRTNSSCKMLSDRESITVAFAGSVTGKRERTGLTASPSPGAQFFLDVRLDGAHAELTDGQIQTLGRTMGWAMP